MPIYEYKCNDCGHRLDALQKISEPPLVSCPACRQDSLRKLVSAPQFRLKGSGWYETDFKKDKRRNIAGEGEKSDTGDNTESGEKKSGEAAAGKSSSDKPATDKPATDKGGSDKAGGEKTSAEKKAPAAGKAFAKGKESTNK